MKKFISREEMNAEDPQGRSDGDEVVLAKLRRGVSFYRGAVMGLCVCALTWSSALICSAASDVQEVTVRRYGAAAATAENPVQVREIQAKPMPAMVGEQPFGFAVMPKVETPDESWDVVFFRFNLFVGRHRCVYGLDIGILGGMADHEMGGLSISGLFNDIGMSEGALQIAGVLNHADWNFSGLQLAGGFCWTEGAFSGLEIALANKAGRLNGVQIGAFNFAEKGSGLQIGAVNFSEQLEGFQIGAININRDSSVPVCPVLNFAF